MGVPMARLLMALAALSQQACATRTPRQAAPQAPRKAVALAQTSNEGGDAADALSGQFSAAASQTLANLTHQLAQFQRMVAARSSQFQKELLEQDEANKAQEAFNKKIQAANHVVEEANHQLERSCRGLVTSNKQLSRELKGLEFQLETAKAMAAAVDDFAVKETAARKGEEDIGFGEGVDLKLALLSLTSSEASQTSSLADGAKDLVQQERLSVASLTQSFDAASKRGQARFTQLMQEQKKLNATGVELKARKGRLLKLQGKLQAAHDHMQARATRLVRFLQRLATIAARPVAQQGAVAGSARLASSAQAPAQVPAAAAPQPHPHPQPAAPAVIAAPAASAPVAAPQKRVAAAPSKPAPQAHHASAALQVASKPRARTAMRKPATTKAPADDSASKLDSVLDMLKR